jgi:hypothetical protein
LSPSGKVCKGKSKPRPRNGLDLKSIDQRLRPCQPSYLVPRSSSPSEAQGFLFQLSVTRSFGNGALERLDQLGHGREDRAVVTRNATKTIPSLRRECNAKVEPECEQNDHDDRHRTNGSENHDGSSSSRTSIRRSLVCGLWRVGPLPLFPREPYYVCHRCLPKYQPAEVMRITRVLSESEVAT